MDGANGANDSNKSVVVFFPYCFWMDVQEDGGHDGGGRLPEGGLRLRYAGRLLVQSQQDEGGKVGSQRRKTKREDQNSCEGNSFLGCWNHKLYTF